MITLILIIVADAILLSAMPFVKTKSFSASALTAGTAGLIGWGLSFVESVLATIVWIVSFALPFLGPLLLYPIARFLLWWIITTIALFVADQMVEDLEIQGILNTALAALVIGGINSVLYTFLSF
jgi:hypothetical protein